MASIQNPIGDFGNYYYGSKFSREGIDPLKFYTSIHFFNVSIRPYETGAFFENYTPVPPFSLLFYLPFTFVKSATAKIIFNFFSLILFAFAFARLIKTLKNFSLAFYLLPFIFIQPLYSNFHHGQTYLIIAALLFELFIAVHSKQKITAGIIIALLFSLKIFPAFIVLIFIFKKDWKTIYWAVIFTGLLQVVTFVFVGKAVMVNYYCSIFPRLALNDVTEPFLYFNQSFHSFLLDSFVYHPYLNSFPYINIPSVAVVLQLIFYSFLISALVSTALKKDGITSCIFSLLVLILINKYNTVYGMIVLFPFMFLSKTIAPKKILLLCLLLFFACNLPTYKLGNMPLIFQYTKVWLLLLVFCILLVELNYQFNLMHFGICLLLFILPSLTFYKYATDSVLEFRPKRGVLYDFKVNAENIQLYNCLGQKDTVEYINFKLNSFNTTNFTTKNKTLLASTKYVLLSTNYALYMTDKNTGVGMNYLKLIKQP